MKEKFPIKLGVKCAPDHIILKDIQKAGIEYVEIYTSKSILKELQKNIEICRKYNFKYIVHAPNDYFNKKLIFKFAQSIGSSIIVMHNILLETEWEEIKKNKKIKIAVENTSMINELTKLIRNFDLEKCLDFEHIIQETCGLYLEGIRQFIKRTVHIHMTGYTYNSNNWHTHLNIAQRQSKIILDFLYNNGYKGVVISEAEKKYQNYNDFLKLKKFFNKWKKSVKQ